MSQNLNDSIICEVDEGGEEDEEEKRTKAILERDRSMMWKKTPDLGFNLRDLQNGNFIQAKFFTSGHKKQELLFVGQADHLGHRYDPAGSRPSTRWVTTVTQQFYKQRLSKTTSSY